MGTHIKRKGLLLTYLLCGFAALAGADAASTSTRMAAQAERIQPYAENPYYWQYKGKPILLFGGSWQDNLFNHPTHLKDHLDLLVSVGGNYVRNTMSHRNQGNVFPFERNAEGLFDLERFNEAYWDRFATFLRLTHERDIIVQIEIWDPHDHYRDREAFGGWSHSPYNPLNNSNYTAAETGLPTAVDYGVQPRPTEHAFWRTVHELDHIEPVLRYQIAFVDRLLEHSLPYPHVLYCMNNEIGEPTEWGDFWARHVQQRAKEAGVEVFTADMRRNHDIRTEDHHRLYDHPERYTFLDISQVTGDGGQRHYDDVIYVREAIAKHPRPINNVKNYGAAKQSEAESVARAYRFLFAGGASTRFHRPYPIEEPAQHAAASNWGLGLGHRAQTVLRSLGTFNKHFDIFRAAPRNDLLHDREANEAYLLATPGEQYAVYFPAAGSIRLDLSDTGQTFRVRRMDLNTVEWRDEGEYKGGDFVTLSAPAPFNASDAQPENLIVNGGFEASPLPQPPGYTQSIPGWDTDLGVGHLINDAQGPFYTPILGAIPEGQQVYGKQGVGQLLQTVQGLQHGEAFRFTAQANLREGNTAMDLAIHLGSHPIWRGTITESPGSFQEISHKGVYNADWGNILTLEFGNPKGDATILLDNIQLWSAASFGEEAIVIFSRRSDRQD